MNNRKFKLDEQPMAHQLTVHIQNLKASGFTTGYLAKHITEMMPDLTAQIIHLVEEEFKELGTKAKIKFN